MWKLLLLLLVSVNAHASLIAISWDRVTKDVGGGALSSDQVNYRMYISVDGGTFIRVASDLSNPYFEYQSSDDGCFWVYITAFRKDASLESDPSNTEYGCLSSGGLTQPDNPMDPVDDTPNSGVIAQPPGAPEIRMQIFD